MTAQGFGSSFEQILRVIQNSVTKVANGPLACLNVGGEIPAEGVLHNPHGNHFL